MIRVYDVGKSKIMMSRWVSIGFLNGAFFLTRILNLNYLLSSPTKGLEPLKDLYMRR